MMKAQDKKPKKKKSSKKKKKKKLKNPKSKARKGVQANLSKGLTKD